MLARLTDAPGSWRTGNPALTRPELDDAKSGRGSRSQIKTPSASSTDPPVLPTAVQLYTAMLPAPVNDGRLCGGCDSLDTHPDPCDPSISRLWGGKRHWKTGLNSGTPCLYCNRIFDGKYKPIYKTFDKYVSALGSDGALYNAVRGKDGWLQQFYDKCKGLSPDEFRKVRMDWADNNSLVKLKRKDTQRITIEEPDDLMIPYDVYYKKFGSPRSSGRKVMKNKGQIFVLVPDVGYGRVKRAHLSDASINNTVADNRLTAGDGLSELLDRQAAEIENVGIEKATGAALRVNSQGQLGASPKAIAGASTPRADALPLPAPETTSEGPLVYPSYGSLGGARMVTYDTPVVLQTTTTPLHAGQAPGSTGGKQPKRRAAAKPGRLDPSPSPVLAGEGGGAPPPIPLQTTAAAKAAAKAAGRKKRDFFKVVRAWLADLKASEPDNVALYGDEAKTTARWHSRNASDMKEWMQDPVNCPNTAIYDEALTLLKAFTTAGELLLLVSTIDGHLEDSDEFAQAYQHAIDFLKLPPTIASPFPPFMAQAHHRWIITHGSTAHSEFWDAIDTDVLTGKCFKRSLTPAMQEEFIAEKVLAFIAEKVLALTKNRTVFPTDEIVALVESCPLSSFPIDVQQALDK